MSISVACDGIKWYEKADKLYKVEKDNAYLTFLPDGKMESFYTKRDFIAEGAKEIEAPTWAKYKFTL